MCRSLNFNFAIFCIFMLSSQVFAGDERGTPIEEFRGRSLYLLSNCQVRSKHAILEAQIMELRAGRPGVLREKPSAISICQKEARAELKKIFPKAAAMVSKKPTALKLLKDYYAAFLTALGGIDPEASELETDYEKRQGAAFRKGDEIWNRFEIEAG